MHRTYAAAFAFALALLAALPAGAELRRSGFIGTVIEPVAPDAPGVRVKDTVPGSSARDGGLAAGDTIARINGEEVKGVAEFVSAVRRLRAGDVARLQLLRGGERVALDLPIKPKPLEAAPDYDVRYGDVAVNGQLRRTLLTVPRGGGSHPALLFLTGIGCFSQEIANPDDSAGRFLAGLTRAGFVTMRVEKPSMGDSEGPPCGSPQADLDDEVAGYVAGMKALKAAPGVDPDNVFLVGLSIGGVEAPMVAAKEPPKGVVVINTVARGFMEYLLETRRRQGRLKDEAMDVVERGVAETLACNDRMLVRDETPQEIVAREPRCAEHLQYPASYRYMQQWAHLNVAELWKAVDAPTLVVIGKSDFVATQADAPLLVEVIDSFHPGRATLREIPGMDHFLTRAASMKESSRREGPGEFAPQVLSEVAAWLRANSGRS